MTIKLHDTYNVADVFLPAIINGDFSGLSDEDEINLHYFLATLPPSHMITVDDEDSAFARDAVSGLMANVQTIAVYQAV